MTEPPLPPVPPQPGDYPNPGAYPPPGGYYYPPSPAGLGALPKEAYTPWFTRVLAWVIDGLPAGVLVGVGQFLGTSSCISESSDDSYNVSCISQPSTLTYVMWLLALAFVVWNYGYRQGTTGSSIGKSVMKFKVVGEKTGQPIGFGMSIVRQLAHIVDGIICYIGYLFPLWDAKRQTLADKIMTTVCLPV